MDFATHQLKGVTAAWWENYLAARGNEGLVSEDEEEEEGEASAEPDAAASATRGPTALAAGAAIEEVAETTLDDDEPAWQSIPW